MVEKITASMKRALLVFIISLIASVLVVSISYLYKDDIYQDQQSANRAMRNWQNKINSSVENNKIIEKFENNFVSLVNQGVVGEENRLSWFETIQNTTRKRGMPSVKYSITTQAPVKESNLKKEYRGLDVFKSVMTLDIKMAHEGDLFALLNDLKKADGLFTIERCDIEKTARDTLTLDKNMRAYCELGWYTFRNAKNKSGGKNAG